MSEPAKCPVCDLPDCPGVFAGPMICRGPIAGLPPVDPEALERAKRAGFDAILRADSLTDMTGVIAAAQVVIAAAYRQGREDRIKELEGREKIISKSLIEVLSALSERDGLTLDQVMDDFGIHFDVPLSVDPNTEKEARHDG